MTDEEAERQQIEYERVELRWKKEAANLSLKLLKEVDEAVYSMVLDAIIEYETKDICPYEENGYYNSELLDGLYIHALKSAQLRSVLIHIASRLIFNLSADN